jgi:hypothetical protein
MGFPVEGDACSCSADADAKTVDPNWPAVIDRLQTHPDEASTIEQPLFLALTNERNPLTKEGLAAFIKACPVFVTDPKSQVMLRVVENAKTRPEVENALLEANPFLLSGPKRTKTFQIMGFPSNRNENPPFKHLEKRFIPAGLRRTEAHDMDWAALEKHIVAHPEEARIVNDSLFPLEAALQLEEPTSIPFSTVELLLRHCPEAVTYTGSPALYFACDSRKQQDPRVIRAILNADPTLADTIPTCLEGNNRAGLAIHYAIHLPCAAQVLPDLIRANPQSLATPNIVDDIPLKVAAEKRDLPTDVLRILLQEGHRYNVGGASDPGRQLLTEDEYGNDTLMSEFIFSASLNDVLWDGTIGRQHASWDNLCLCLKAAGAFRTGRPSVEEMWDHPLLHGVIEFVSGRWRWIFFDKVFNACQPNDLTRLDAAGRTPLVVAIERAGKFADEDDDDDEDSMAGSFAGNFYHSLGGGDGGAGSGGEGDSRPFSPAGAGGGIPAGP